MPSKEPPLDSKTRKDIAKAERGLDELERAIRPAVRQMHNRVVIRDKAIKAMKKALSFMAKSGSLGRLKGSPPYEQLSPEVKLLVDWMDGMLGEVLRVEDRLIKAKKMLEFDPVERHRSLLRAMKEAFQIMPSAPRGTQKLIKEIQDGVKPDSPEGQLVTILPMALLLWYILDAIDRGMAARPAD
jgi:hypothetical protein